MESPVFAAISLIVGIFRLPPGAFDFLRLPGVDLMLRIPFLTR